MELTGFLEPVNTTDSFSATDTNNNNINPLPLFDNIGPHLNKYQIIDWYVN